MLANEVVMIRRSQKRKSAIVVTSLTVVLCAAIVLAYPELIERPGPRSEPAPLAGSSHFTRAPGRYPDSAVQPMPQASGAFDLSTSVIAGGGGSSSGGVFRVDGTVGQPAAGTTQSGGQFSLTTGFGSVVQGSTPTPTGHGVRELD